MNELKNKNMNTPIYLLADFYKLSHRKQYPEGTEVVYSTWTPRSDKWAGYETDGMVVFGIQYFVKEYLIKRFNEEFFERPIEEVVNIYTNFVTQTLGSEHADANHLVELHKLGYLPIELSALPEGTIAPIKVPVLTIRNTKPEFYWLTNYLETIMSTTLWLGMNNASLAHAYKKLLVRYAKETADDLSFVPFQAHDFSMRGLSSEQSASLSGASHLLSFVGSDTIPAGFFAQKYYNANFNEGLLMTSIPATEHSVMCSYGQESEMELLRHLMVDVYPSGLFSVVSDTWDFWKLVTEYLPQLKETIMNRDGKVVIRPDSGDPVEILTGKNIVRVSCGSEFFDHNDAVTWHKIYRESADEQGNLLVFVEDEGVYYRAIPMSFPEAMNLAGLKLLFKEDFKLVKLESGLTAEDKGLIETLYETFGGTVNGKGYKELDAHIGAIYGDSITIKRAEQICERLKQKGFASTNVVLGVGSFSYQYNTRDTYGQAIKATYAIVNGEERLLFKDPKTDSGVKKSQKGMVSVFEQDGKLTYQDGLLAKDKGILEKSLLQPVFRDGVLLKDVTFTEVKERLASYLD